MLLAIDIGNSAVKLACFKGESIAASTHFRHMGASDQKLLTDVSRWLDHQPVDEGALCSVVPAIGSDIYRLVSRRFSSEPFVLSHRHMLPIRLEYAEPERIGTDRIAAAAAAFGFVAPTHGASGRPVIALDAGTAVTLNVVGPDGVFRGGVIWAGPDLVRWALHTRTAQLPLGEMPFEPKLIADNTSEAIAAGARYGFAEGVRGLLRRMDEQLGEPAFVVVTGGRGPDLASMLSLPVLEPNLVLHGLRLARELNRDGVSPSSP